MGLLALVAGALAGCSTAPAAATVNGQPISEQQLAEQLQSLSSDSAYTSAQDGIFLEAFEESEGQGSPPTVAPPPGQGSGSGSYSMLWTDLVLSNMISEVALTTNLERAHMAPDSVQLAAAWASEYANDPAEWEQLTPSLRSSEALYDADRALVDGPVPAASSKSVASFYTQHASYFWSQVCLTAVDVPAARSAMASAKKQAESVARELSGHTGPGEQPVLGASLYCDSPEQFVEQPSSFQAAVAGLAPGNAQVLAESYGYQVVAVRSRTVLRLSAASEPGIDVVVSYGGVESPPQGEQKVIDVLNRARVQVNPRFGSWSKAPPATCPQVLPAGSQAGGCIP